MTTIVAVQSNDGVIFGADSQVTAPNGRKYSSDRMVKISERNKYIIAGSGEVAPCDIAQHIWNPPTPTAADKRDLYHFMVAKVVPSLKQCFKDNDYKPTSDDDETAFLFLIAVCGEVFEIADDFSVIINDEGFYGVGSGSGYALGSLWSGKPIEDALTIAARLDAYTSAPFIYKQQRKPKKRNA
jgi:ATP-dependent protease HslVU (ClpYQ) peptidase subunit